MLLPIGDRTFLDHMLEPVTMSGLRRFHFCLGRDLLDETFLLMLGDTDLNIDYAGLSGHLPDDMMGLMVLTRADSDVAPNVRLEAGIVTGYDKSGIPGGWIDTGVSVLRRAALDLPPDIRDIREPFDLSVLFRDLIRRRRLAGVTTPELFFDIGTPDRYRTLADHLMSPTPRR